MYNRVWKNRKKISSRPVHFKPYLENHNGKWELVCDLSNDVVFNDLEWHLYRL